ncbi:hypothetical protein BDV95DRAFT_592515 [Massariosphaeria phaeospora]|uniref:Uncharacterized protein n=1 Tax=Massariosphaeria phaeospora TaxID=100035 RepID=A0A7C8IA35_9PLEO|nr:hypothetical protein BDV95DRAFT_592515 [Massariosphaeria phaeospora]
MHSRYTSTYATATHIPVVTLTTYLQTFQHRPNSPQLRHAMPSLFPENHQNLPAPNRTKPRKNQTTRHLQPSPAQPRPTHLSSAPVRTPPSSNSDPSSIVSRARSRSPNIYA